MNALPPIAELALALLAVLLVGRGRHGTWAALFVIVLGGVGAWVRDGAPWQRCGMAWFPLMAALAAVRIGRGGPYWTAQRRIWQLVATFDIRDATRIPPTFAAAALGRVLAEVAIFVGGILLLHVLELPPTLRPWVRLLVGAAIVHAFVALLSDIGIVAHAAVGVRAPPIQRTPLGSRSLAEFWNQRWNRYIGEWLRHYIFRPLTRHLGARVGLWGAFVVSGLLHFWLAGTAVGAIPGLWLASYFLIQAALVTAEPWLAVARWPGWAARSWTIAAVLIPMRIGVDVFLAVLGL